MWVLIISVFWYHAPSVTEVEFSSQQACEQAKEAALKEFHSDGWFNGATFGSKAICVKK